MLAITAREANKTKAKNGKKRKRIKLEMKTMTIEKSSLAYIQCYSLG